jgi:hypothetical protein
MEISCPICHRSFKIRPSTVKRRVCCSRKCYGEYKKQHPEKYNLFQEGHKGYVTSPWLGKTRPLNTRIKMSESHKNNPKVIKHLKELGKKQSRENHWNWKGGITDENKLLRRSEEYKSWRSKVYLRDKWTCQKCGKKLKNLVAHHKKSFKDYPKLRFNVSNGLTLCRSCHKKVHEEIGKQTRWKKKQ